VGAPPSLCPESEVSIKTVVDYQLAMNAHNHVHRYGSRAEGLPTWRVLVPIFAAIHPAADFSVAYEYELIPPSQSGADDYRGATASTSTST
jgi:hypothetical protein